MKQRESQNEDGRPSQSKGRATLIFTPVIVSDRGCNRRARLADDIFTSTRRTVWCLSSVHRKTTTTTEAWWVLMTRLLIPLVHLTRRTPPGQEEVSLAHLVVVGFFFLCVPSPQPHTHPPACEFLSESKDADVNYHYQHHHHHQRH